MDNSLKSGENGLPSVSVIIPAYNAADHVAAALRSVFAQTFTDFEVILVNDGSPDTGALEEALQPYLSRICYVHQENRGPSSARNCGILKSRGRFIAFLDSDDFWLPPHLERQIDTFQRNPELGLIYSNAVHLKKNRPVGVAFETVRQLGEPTFEKLLAEDCTVNTSSVVVRRDVLLRAGLFDEAMSRCEDFDLWLRLAGAGVRMAYDRKIQVGHRLGEGLSADSILMKQGRMRAYKKTLVQPGITQVQRNLATKKLSGLEAEIQTETVKRMLIAGQYQEALAAAAKARSLQSRSKLRVAALGLRYCPRLLKNGYTIYLRALQSYKQARQAHAMKKILTADNFPELESLTGQRPTP